MLPPTYIERWYAASARRLDVRDHVARADHRPAERVVAEHRLREEVVHELLRRVLVHRDLLEHDLALGVELGERRREDHVRHHVERRREVRVGNACVDDRVLARGRRVELAAEPVEDLGDVLRAVARRALEEQVLEEMRDACPLLLLVARSGADPVAERDRPDARHALGDHALARVELGYLVLPHRRIVGGEAYPDEEAGTSIRRATGISARSTSSRPDALEPCEVAGDIAERAPAVERGEHPAVDSSSAAVKPSPSCSVSADLVDVPPAVRVDDALLEPRVLVEREPLGEQRAVVGELGEKVLRGEDAQDVVARRPEPLARKLVRAHPVVARAAAEDHCADGDPLDPEPLKYASQRSIAAAYASASSPASWRSQLPRA